MKTIKFFSLAVLLSLAWAACKDSTSASTETNNQLITADSLAMLKSAVSESLGRLTGGVAGMITQIETELATATDARKAELNTQLGTFKQYQAEIQSLTQKVNESTPDTWPAVYTEVQDVSKKVKPIFGAGSTLNGADAKK